MITANDWFHLHVPMVYVSPTPTLPTSTCIKPHDIHPTQVSILEDYILVKCRMMPSVLDTRVLCGADIDSDHRFVVTSVRLKLRGRPKETRGRRFDVKCLQDADTIAAFVNTIEQDFQRQRAEGSVEDRWKAMETVALRVWQGTPRADEKETEEMD